LLSDDAEDSGAGAAVLGRQHEYVETGLDRKDRAVKNQVIKAWIVLTGAENDPGVGISRPIHFLLVPTGTRFVDSLSDRVGDARFERAIETDTEGVGPVAQNDHSGPSENDPTRGAGDAMKLRFTLGSKWLECLGYISRNLAGPHERRGIGEGHEDSFPAPGDVLIEAFGDLGGRGQLSGHFRGDGPVKERDIQPRGEEASNLVAFRTIGSRNRDYRRHLPIGPHLHGRCRVVEGCVGPRLGSAGPVAAVDGDRLPRDPGSVVRGQPNDGGSHVACPAETRDHIGLELTER
jgi:hypothetical protein